ncbi:MAG: hypothetical protein J6I45_03515, partial [Clostridia bacterium]|nr:hypothetical protein [Clostridia bacterium]
VSTPNEYDAGLLAMFTEPVAIEVSSSVTAATENTIRIEVGKQVFEIAINLYRANQFEEHPATTKPLIEKANDFIAIADDIFAALQEYEELPIIGSYICYEDFYFVTEDGYTFDIYYHGEGEGNFAVLQGTLSDTESSTEIVYEDGKYIFKLDEEEPEMGGGQGNVDIAFPYDAEWTCYPIVGSDEYGNILTDENGIILTEDEAADLIALLSSYEWVESLLTYYTDSDYVAYIDNWETAPYEVSYDADAGIVMLWMYDLEAQLTAEQQEELDALIAEITAE